MTQPVVKVLSDPEQVREGRETAEQIRERELADLRAVLSTPEGRRWMTRFLDRCGLMTQHGFMRNGAGLDLAFNAGIREVACKLVAEVKEAAPEEYYRMMLEAQTAELDERKRLSAKRSAKRAKKQEKSDVEDAEAVA